MKVPLNVVERLSLLNSVPAKGTMRDMKVAQALKKKVGFTDIEMQKFGISQVGEQISWFPEANRDVDIDFTVEEAGVVVKRLKELDTLGEIKDEHITIWDKFVQE